MGKGLLQRLITVSETQGYWTFRAHFFTANEASRALHAKCGFREIGTREPYGLVNGVWHDVMLLERRSDRAGGPGLPTKVCER